MLGRTKFFCRASDFTTFSNNYYTFPVVVNGAIATGIAPNGTGTFAAWEVLDSSDPNNTGMIRLEAQQGGYAQIATKARGTGTAETLVIQQSGGKIGLFGKTSGNGIQTVTGSKNGNAALTSLIAAMVAYGAIVDSTS